MVQPSEKNIYTGPIQHKITIDEAIVPFNVYECSNGSFVKLSDFLKIQDKCIEYLEKSSIGFMESIEQINTFTGDFTDTISSVRLGARRDLERKEWVNNILKIALVISVIALAIIAIALVCVVIL